MERSSKDRGSAFNFPYLYLPEVNLLDSPREGVQVKTGSKCCLHDQGSTEVEEAVKIGMENKDTETVGEEEKGAYSGVVSVICYQALSPGAGTHHSTPDVAQLQVGEAGQAEEHAVIGQVQGKPEGTRNDTV